MSSPCLRLRPHPSYTIKRLPLPPWRTRMTLCIAVACKIANSPRLVLCTDWKEEVEGIGSAEISNKLDWIKDGWAALTAGTASRCDELVGLYTKHLYRANITLDNILEEMKKPAQMHKGALAEDYIQQLLGMPYSHFLKTGKEQLPEDFFREKVSDIGRIKLGASLIIAGFVQGRLLR